MKTHISRLLADLPFIWRAKDHARIAELRLRYAVARLEERLGRVEKSADYTRFVLLSRARSGTNFLRGMLNAHPLVACFTELFRRPTDLQWGLSNYPDDWPSAMRQRNTDPEGFLSKWVFCEKPITTKAVGFKLFYDQGHNLGNQDVWGYLESHPEVRVIHLKRRNLLRVVVSFERARISGEWKVEQGSRVSRDAAKGVRVQLDPVILMETFRAMELESQKAVDRFAPERVFELFYEDLLRDDDRWQQDLLGFLGVAADVELLPNTERQSSRPLCESIENFDQQRAFFAGTEWAAFFD